MNARRLLDLRRSRLGRLLVPEPPAAGASRLERLRWVRRLTIRQLPLFGLASVFLVLDSEWVVLAACWGTFLINGAALSWRIRRLRASEPRAHAERNGATP